MKGEKTGNLPPRIRPGVIDSQPYTGLKQNIQKLLRERAFYRIDHKTP